ncbi:hypothetical protein ACH5RR_006423 [Cinchona calisaya]|uniref:Uncharacterized protein n=1 Tax=Cinchona calisaya TaxID=153742 RepID=A0ABD3AP88_9GENT
MSLKFLQPGLGGLLKPVKAISDVHVMWGLQGLLKKVKAMIKVYSSRFDYHTEAATAPQTGIVEAQTPVDREDDNGARRGRDSTNLSSSTGNGSTCSSMESNRYSLGIHSSSSDIFINVIATTARLAPIKSRQQIFLCQQMQGATAPTT